MQSDKHKSDNETLNYFYKSIHSVRNLVYKLTELIAEYANASDDKMSTSSSGSQIGMRDVSQTSTQSGSQNSVTSGLPSIDVLGKLIKDLDGHCIRMYRVLHEIKQQELQKSTFKALSANIKQPILDLIKLLKSEKSDNNRMALLVNSLIPEIEEYVQLNEVFENQYQSFLQQFSEI